MAPEEGKRTRIGKGERERKKEKSLLIVSLFEERYFFIFFAESITPSEGEKCCGHSFATQEICAAERPGSSLCSVEDMLSGVDEAFRVYSSWPSRMGQ